MHGNMGWGLRWISWNRDDLDSIFNKLAFCKGLDVKETNPPQKMQDDDDLLIHILKT